MLRRPLRYFYHRFLKPRYVRHRIRAARGSMRLDFYGPEIGFFAQLTACLHFFRHAEATGFVPIIRLTSPNYLDSAMGGDWFDYHFLRLGQAAAGGRRPLRIGNISEMPEFPHALSLAEAHALFFRHVAIRPEVLQGVADFAVAHDVGPRTLGLHYRGTDKVEEAARVDYDDVFAVVARVLHQRPDLDGLFVASDDQGYIAAAQDRFPGRVKVAEDALRSVDGRPVHLGGRAAGNHRIGRDALCNALLLARCGLVVRSTSFLSAWASIFNPGLEVILLNAPYAHKLWYPESKILETATLAPRIIAGICK